MKKIILIVMSLFFLQACSFNDEATNFPDEVEIKNIVKLSTLEAYYHNVAKATKKPGTKIQNFGETERRFWIEYTGKANLGIDVSKVTMKIDGKKVIITLPKAEIIGNLEIDEKDFNEDSYIASNDGLNKNKIEVKDQLSAIMDSQKDMEKSINRNTILLDKAQERAKKLIENYINMINEATGQNYKIEWKKIENVPEIEYYSSEDR